VDTPSLRSFVDDVFASLGRVDQRRWAQTYLQALLTVAGKKTLRRLARHVSSAPAAAHGLQRFINASPWEWTPVRRRLAQMAVKEGTARAWTLAELTIPKKGEHSVGVQRSFDAETGRTVNCQQALGLFLATDTHCVPVEWTLVLGEAWCADELRRRRARIPETVFARSAWAHVLDLAATVAAQPEWASLPWVLDLRHVPEAGLVMEGLAERGLDFVCEVSAEQPVISPHAASSVTGVTAVQAHMARSQIRQPHLVMHQMQGRAASFAVAYESVRLLNRAPGSCGSQRLHRCVSALSAGGRQGARFWITSFTDRRVEEILALARLAAATECAVAEVATDFGVHDFEGRSYPGWHHHITMASAAYAFRHLCA
jgi:hypothetical protein